jgi:tetratricopeptide (TPR) repeat protein
MTSTDAPAPAAVPPAPRPARRRRLWLWLAVPLLVAGGLMAREGWGYWHLRAAQAAMSDERFDEARRHVELALRVRGGSAHARLLAARIARHRGEYAETEEQLNRCAEIGGMTESVQLEWMLLRCVRGEVDELSPTLSALVERRHPESTAILEVLADVYMRQTRYMAALRCLNRWLELAPDTPRALDWRGWVSNQLDDRSTAVADYERALELCPGRSLVRLRLAELFVESSRPIDAVPHLERLRVELPENNEVMVLLARCRVVEARTDEARDLLDAVLAADPDDGEALMWRGKLEQTLGNLDEAERWLRKALERSPRNVEARYTLYLCLQAQPDRQKDAREELARWEEQRKVKGRLVRLLRSLVDRSPNDPDLAEETGRLLLEEGEDEKGLYWLYRSLRLDPRHAASHRDLVAYYERTNNSAKAAEHRQKLEALGGK